jgi:uncharacterized protein (TIGR00375 family)
MTSGVCEQDEGLLKVNLDLHIHSRYSAATSERMTLQEISKVAPKKGIKIVGTGDCLHPLWEKEIRALPEEEGLFRLNDTLFLPTVEVEDLNSVHHLILLPDLSKALELREAFAQRSANINSDGRPSLRMSGSEISDAAIDAGCLIGPCHAFTPWTGFFAHHRSLHEGYEENYSKISFIELGLSADSDYADRISALHDLSYLSNSDAHSPWANKLGREFNQMLMKSLCFDEVRSAILRQNRRRPSLNVGLFPEEGKYNRTACIRCYRQYSHDEMTSMMGRCSCGGLIKLGVRDRVALLSDMAQPRHPGHRPPYLHLIPLSEIIALALCHSSVHTAGVQRVWNELVDGRSEAEVLVEADLDKIEMDQSIRSAIMAFREGRVSLSPGGGGRYGKLSLPGTNGPLSGQKSDQKQRGRKGQGKPPGKPAQCSLSDYIGK